MYEQILANLRENAGKVYRKPDRITDPTERQAMSALKNRMNANAGQFKELVFKSLESSHSRLVYANQRGVKFLDGTGTKIRDYLWIQLKDSQYQDNSISISVFANIDSFRVTTEYTGLLSEDEARAYKKIFETPITDERLVYYKPAPNHADDRVCSYEEAKSDFSIEPGHKYQVSRTIKQEDFSTDENLVQLIAESINILTPIYENVFSDGAPTPNAVTEDEDDGAEDIEETPAQTEMPAPSLQLILFGAPGTGKSYKIDDPDNGYGLKRINKEFKFRTTFHPDYDYAQFVGAYKPTSLSRHLEEGGNNSIAITYSFVPQVFAKAYVRAWAEYLKAIAQDQNAIGEKVYLVIEEINRGNCAQIFGDIFQLLDRDCGHSAYPINIDSDFAKYIENELKKITDIEDAWDKYKNKIQEWDSPAQGEECANDDFCKIALPPNLNILATMNTSDQSLYPMDSAFKRRFDWEYVPINYSHPKAGFSVAGPGIDFKWLNFLKKINADIYQVTQSEDKQMGEFFIKPKNGTNITLDEFRSKVLFYLWESIYKDDPDLNKFFHINYPDANGFSVTFQKLFENNDVFPNILKMMLTRLDREYASIPEILPTAGANNSPVGDDEDQVGNEG